jgi:hypothetical protein
MSGHTKYIIIGQNFLIISDFFSESLIKISLLKDPIGV